MKINFIYSPDVSLEQMIGYEMAATIWGQLFTDDIEINILAKTSDQLGANVIGGAIPEFHEQHYALFLQYFEADITSEEDQQAYDALQQGNTVDFLLNGDLISGNTKLKLTTALAKALGMDEAISLDRYTLDESTHLFDGTIMMNQDFAWDFNYLRDSAAAENTVDFLSVALHETGHILGFVSSLDYSLQQDTLYSGRTELNNFSPLDLFRFSAQSLALENPDGQVNDLSIGGVAWFSTDGGETLSAKMSTGKEGDGYQASHWERRYDPLGIMDPTLWYQERASITDLDVLAFDIMGYDLAHNATEVEQLFTTEGLELALAQAKVNLANKLGVSVEWLENNSEVPLSSLETIADIEAALVETTSDNGTESTATDTTSGSAPDFIKDLDNMMKDIYQWWSQSSGKKGSSWQELYEWWAQSSGKKGSSWQELYEWWAQSSGKKGSSWQELYEWWAQSSGKKGSSWQELYEWWAQDNGNKGSWWQEVFFASQDGENNLVLEDIELPGQNTNTVDATYKEISGGQDDDIIGGDISNDDIIGGAGDDLIDGGAGDDTIVGGTGYDTIFGFDGNDSIEGGEGDDVISGESGNDALFGQAGADVLMGGEQDDYLDGGEGRDFLSGNTGHDALVGGAGDDALEGEAGKDLLVGGEGKDIGNGGSGDDFIFGDDYSAILQQAFGENVGNLTTLFTPTTQQNTSTDTSTSDTSTTEDVFTVELGQDPLRVEAEDMSRSGSGISTSGNVGGAMTTLFWNPVNNYSAQSSSTLSTVFNGSAGLYDIVIAYHDVYGSSNITASLQGTELDNWSLNKSTQATSPNSYTFVTRTIAEGVSLGGGESLVLNTTSYNNYANQYDRAYIDYVEFVPVADNTSTNNLVLGQDPIRMEAEDLNLTGGYTQDNGVYYNGAIAYNGSIITINPNSTSGVASGNFTGEAGYYKVLVRYVDENDGQSPLSIKIGGAEIDSLLFDQNTSNSPHQYQTHTVSEGMYINANDTIEIEGQRQNQEWARVDYIEFIPIEAPTDNSSDNTDSSPSGNLPSGIVLGANSDILRGGYGNDGIDGGEGNDIIFGEDEFNNSSSIAPVNIADSLNYGYSTYLLSQVGTLAEAQAEAQSYGGNLVTINDAEEEDWLKNNFGDLKWVNDQAPTYTNWQWTWNSASDTGTYQGIIEIDWSSIGGNDTVFGGTGDDQIYGNSGNDSLYGDYTETSNLITFQQGVNGYNSTVDTYIHAYYQNNDYGNADSVLVGNSGVYPLQGILRFDDIFGSEAGQIALDDTINSAFLELDVSDPGSGFQVKEVTGNWSESDNWSSITAKGVGADKIVATTGSVGTGILRIDVTESLLAWQADSTSNEGWAFLATGSDGVIFDSSEGNNAPRLVLDVNEVYSNILTGNGGNDTLTGSAGDDILNGTDEVVAGYYEKDVLIGGDGADKFILGDADEAYYATAGYQDYAVIEDFDSSLDNIQLHGSAGDYQQQQQGNHLFLSHSGDLVAILENTTTLNLSSNAVEYVTV